MNYHKDKHHNASIGSHECPGCHRCNWGLGIYDGDETPRVRNGADPGATVKSAIHQDQAGAYTPHGGCPWSIKIAGYYYRCIHPDGMKPHAHQYRGPDGQVYDAPETDPAPGW
jgi:hypothetical protein